MSPHIAGRNVKRHSHSGKQVSVLLKWNVHISYNPPCTPGHLSHRDENLGFPQILNTVLPVTDTLMSISNHPNCQTALTCLSGNGRQSVLHPCGISLDSKSDRATDTWDDGRDQRQMPSDKSCSRRL